MNNTETKIPCPSCNTTITINVQQLLQGAHFTCQGCQASIGIASQSKVNDEENNTHLKKPKKDLK